ncbi:hypothetical protein [Hymenobacter canadensis]|uniref:Uncharacterized protein n=1 Tax=Hymenobacter canadensis TaxID=2999067 RepID=A0ABY7LNJ0_9BACT|nr:hypothetical protein [Hymenobacter canadensis]WBA41502.1 hypothetical protein O3303_17010 [Hymenobacter canadensis]
MDNKQNQPNAGQNSSAANAANKPASPSSSATLPAAALSASATPDAARSSQSAPAAAAIPAPTANKDNRSEGISRVIAGADKDAGRKSWLDQDQWSKSINELPQSLKDLGSKALNQVNSLTPTQKVVGGALLVSGLSWLALRSKSSKPSVAGSRYTPNAESKWKPSNESVYRGSTSAERSTDFDNDSF